VLFRSDMVRAVKARGTAIVAICHDADVRDAIADRLFEMAPYQEAAQDTAQEVI